MAVIRTGIPAGTPDVVNLSALQTGNVSSTNIADRRGSLGPALLEIVTTVGAGPTVTVAIQGCCDEAQLSWFNIAYSDPATPETVAVATFAITSATTTRRILRPNHPWRYLQLVYSANTNVTIASADLYVFPG